MLAWLKDILKEHYTDEIDGAVSKKIGEDFVSRADFNEKNEAVKRLEKDLKDRDTQLDNLKKTEGSTEELKNQIADLQKQNKEAKEKYDADIAKIKLDNAVETALTAAGAKNNVAVKALLGEFLSKAKLEENGTVSGLAEEIKKLTDSESTSFLFNASEPNHQFSGMKPGNSGGNPPPAEGDTSKMSYSEFVAYQATHPDATY